MSRISLVQLAGSVRKFNLNRLFICPILSLYMYLDYAPERIYSLLPEVKLLFILRNPVGRAYSHYWHE